MPHRHITLTASSGVLSSVTGDQTYSASVIDSRGRSASIPSQTITVWQYNLPTLDNVSILRCTSAGVIDPTGNYVKPTYTAGYSSLDGNNTATISLQYRELGASSWSRYSGTVTSGTAITLPGQEGVDVSKTYEMRLSIHDALNTVYSTLVSVPSARRVLNVNPTGDSLAVGGFADVNATDQFEVYWDSIFRGNVTMNGLSYRGELTSSDDLNDITESGIYYINDPMPSNCPTGATYSKLFVTGKDNVPTQIIVRADATSANIWTRIYGGNPASWRAWKTFTDIDSTNALIYRGELTSSDDLNDIKDTGIYFITSSVPLNAPLMASTYTIVLVIHPYGNFVQQLYYHTHLTQGYPQFAVRQYSGATPSWDTWRYVNDMPFAKGIHQITANSDLNNYTDTGVYYCSNSATTQSLSNSPYTQGIWVDGTTGFRLEVYNTTGSGYGFQILYTHNVVQRTYIRSLNDSTWRSWHRLVGDDETYYRVNDTFASSAYMEMSGHSTGNAKRIVIGFTVPKSMANISTITVTRLTGSFFGSGGLINSATDTNWLTTSGITLTPLKTSDNTVRIYIDSTTAFTNTAFYTPVSYYGHVTLKFT